MVQILDRPQIALRPSNKNLKLNKTSLYNHHILLNAKMVNFASYLMPINYDRGIKYEYDSVRNDVGIFDVSHMGVFKVSGKESESFLNKVLSNIKNKNL